MSIPLIDEAVPEQFSLEASKEKLWQYFALGAVTNWSLPQADIRKALKGKLTPYDVAMKAAKFAIESKCAKLDYMHVNVLIADTFQGAFGYEPYNPNSFLRSFNVDPHRPHIFLGTESGADAQSAIIQVMEPVFQRLNTDIERALFYRALRMIEHSQHRFAPIATPAKSLHKVRVQHWEYHYDEVGYFDDQWDRVGEGDEIEDLQRGLKMQDIRAPDYTFNELKTKLGHTMFAPRGSVRLADKDVQSLCASGSETVSNIARAVVACADVFKRNKSELLPSLEDTDHDLIVEASFLRWNEDDDVLKIYDDYANHQIQMGGCVTNVFGIIAYQCDSFESAMKVVRSIDAMCDELVAVNNLIGAISVPE